VAPMMMKRNMKVSVISATRAETME
jgi:hypothetical protein